jgi:MoxR-like ATPase
MAVPIPALETLGFDLEDDQRYRRLGSTLGDRRDGRVYVHDDRIRTAVRVAIATRRPLLLRGDPGSGKSSLAPFIARALKWRFHSFTVTGRTQARDLMWHFDALRRLSDAQVVRGSAQPGSNRVDHLEYYIEPKALWWALDPVSARRRGLPDSHVLEREHEAKDPGIGPERTSTDVPSHGRGVVVLIDEIDKADPDVPNNLLESLGSLQFTVQETNFAVTASHAIRNGNEHPPLVMVTTNNERELPTAFQRRCVTLYLRRHEPPALIDIATRQFPVEAGRTDARQEAARRQALFGTVAAELTRLRKEAKDSGRREPSTAEYLDAVKACLALPADPDTEKTLWQHIAQMTLSKQDPYADTEDPDQQAGVGV